MSPDSLPPDFEDTDHAEGSDQQPDAPGRESAGAAGSGDDSAGADAARGLAVAGLAAAAAVAAGKAAEKDEPAADKQSFAAAAMSPYEGSELDFPVPDRVKRAARTVFFIITAFGVAVLAWALLGVVPRYGLGSPALTDPSWAWIVAGAAATICGLSGLLIRPESADARGQTRTAAIWTVTLLASLVALWWLIGGSQRETQWRGTPVQTQAQVDAYLDTVLPEVMPGQTGAPRIPTGVSIQSVEFKGGANVQAAGYIWMTFPKDLPEGYEKGFVLPDAVTDAYSAKEAYRVTQPTGEETIGWYFAATMRQAFDYSRYPFDRPNVQIRIWAKDFSRGGVIVPALDDYMNLTPSTLPGIESEFVSGSWDPVFSGFSYDTNVYNMNFGFPGNATGAGAPELYYNFVLKRDPINPFTDQLFYGLTVALLIFGLLTLTAANPEHRGRFGISTAGVLGSVSVLLFGVIAKQSSLRAGLDSTSMTYLEVLPVSLYLMLIITALNAILVCAPFDVRLLEYRNNILPELLYWPILLTIIVTVTMVVFYA